MRRAGRSTHARLARSRHAWRLAALVGAASAIGTAVAVAGASNQAPTAVATSPQATDVADGARLFVAYNCADCHGAGGSGAMGPSLQDNRWRFGGSSEDITRSIVDGRPEGMPAWKPFIPGGQVRLLVAYIETLGRGKDLTTENFTGTTVERTGH